MKFLNKQVKRSIEKESCAFDTISSFLEMQKQVKDGRNKVNDRLPKINLALLFGDESGLRFNYRKLARY